MYMNMAEAVALPEVSSESQCVCVTEVVSALYGLQVSVELLAARCMYMYMYVFTASGGYLH